MNPQIIIRESVRLIIFMGCIGFTLFAIHMMSPENTNDEWCDIHHATDCYDRLAVRK